LSHPTRADDHDLCPRLNASGVSHGPDTSDYGTAQGCEGRKRDIGGNRNGPCLGNYRKICKTRRTVKVSHVLAAGAQPSAACW
jgi:hypothetical protein